MKLSPCKPQIKKFQFHKYHRLLIDFLVYAWSSNTCLLHSWIVFTLSDVSYCDSDSVIDVGRWEGVCVISSVLSCHTKIWSGRHIQLHVTAQIYLEITEKYILEAWENASPKDVKRREASGPILAPLFICFFLFPLGLLHVNWASQECCLFYLRSSLLSLDLPLFYFHGLFPFLVF